MKTLRYSIHINKPKEFVYNKIIDKSVYPDWAKAWGTGMTYEGQWVVGQHISFFDDSKGGTKVIIEEMIPGDAIKTKHVAMVNPQNIEIELADEMMQKWIGSREDYFFTDDNETGTTLEVVMTVDEAFQEMFDSAWPHALQLFKEVCER